jgi:hypothetical protein
MSKITAATILVTIVMIATTTTTILSVGLLAQEAHAGAQVEHGNCVNGPNCHESGSSRQSLFHAHSYNVILQPSPGRPLIIHSHCTIASC